jgi:hypothetical protein
MTVGGIGVSGPNDRVRETPDTVHGRLMEAASVYGRLLEGGHLAGYTFERAATHLEWLLEGDRWQKVGSGFDDVNVFMASIRFDDFRLLAEQRKRIARRIKELQPAVSQRQIADTLGVSHQTIGRDLDENGPHGPDKSEISNNDADLDDGAGPHGPPPVTSLISGTEAARLIEQQQATGTTRDGMAVHYSSDTPEWYTPSHIITAVVHGIAPAWGTSPDGVEFGTRYLWREAGADYPDGPEDERRCPYGVPGDRLWVREAWTADTDGRVAHAIDPESESQWWHEVPPMFRGAQNTGYLYYRADGAVVYGGEFLDQPWQHRTSSWVPTEDELEGRRWLPPIHMPRWASRITLEVAGVRVERLQDITEEDARAEGVHPIPGVMFEEFTAQARRRGMAGPLVYVFEEMWNELNVRRGYGWDSNPWVWVIEFKDGAQ